MSALEFPSCSRLRVRSGLRNRVIGRHTSHDRGDKEHDNKDCQLSALDEDPAGGEVGNEDSDKHALCEKSGISLRKDHLASWERSLSLWQPSSTPRVASMRTS